MSRFSIALWHFDLQHCSRHKLLYIFIAEAMAMLKLVKSALTGIKLDVKSKCDLPRSSLN